MRHTNGNHLHMAIPQVLFELVAHARAGFLITVTRPGAIVG